MKRVLSNAESTHKRGRKITGKLDNFPSDIVYFFSASILYHIKISSSHSLYTYLICKNFFQAFNKYNAVQTIYMLCTRRDPNLETWTTKLHVLYTRRNKISVYNNHLQNMIHTAPFFFGKMQENVSNRWIFL